MVVGYGCFVVLLGLYAGARTKSRHSSFLFRSATDLASAEEDERRAKEKDTWMAVIVAGLGIAGGATYAQGGTLAKVASAVPKTVHLVKAGAALLKRNAGVAVAKAVLPQVGSHS